MNCFDTNADFPPPIVNITDCNCSNPDHIYEPICECPYPEELAPTLWQDLTPGLAYGAVFLIGTIGNLLVIFVFNQYKSMRSVTNLFLASLSTADLCLIWFCVPVQYLKYISYSWPMGEFMCYAVHFVQQFTMVCSVLTLTAISIERYLAIVYPMKSMWLSSIGRAKKTVIIIWTVSIISASPTAARIEYYIAEPDHMNRSAHWCLQQFPLYSWASEQTVNNLEQAHALYQFILFLIIPVCTMAYCYIHIGLVVYASSANNKPTPPVSTINGTDQRLLTPNASAPQLSRSSSVMGKGNNQRTKTVADSNKKQIVHMLVAIVVLYVICWSPTIVDELLVGFNIICGLSITKGLRYMRLTFAALEYIQSCANPVVYAFMSTNFRQSVLNAMRRQKTERRRRQEFERMQMRSSQKSRTSISAKNRRSTIKRLKKERENTLEPVIKAVPNENDVRVCDNTVTITTPINAQPTFV